MTTGRTLYPSCRILFLLAAIIVLSFGGYSFAQQCGDAACDPIAGENPADCPQDCGGPSCGEAGGDYCTYAGACPAGYRSLGNTWDCLPCCTSNPCGNGVCDAARGETPSSCPGDCTGLSCGELGGNACSLSGSCPVGHISLGYTWDCEPCCLSVGGTRIPPASAAVRFEAGSPVATAARVDPHHLVCRADTPACLPPTSPGGRSR